MSSGQHVHARSSAARARELARRIMHYGASCRCPVCGASIRAFLPHGVGERRRENAVCPVCLCRDRHRLAWLFMQHVTDLFRSPVSMLHVAPEPALAARLSGLRGLDYLSIDIRNQAMRQMNINALDIADSHYHAVYCSHVLNMLPDDRPAIRELFRVTAPGGWALVQVPSTNGLPAVELDAKSKREERLAALGDPDMFRRYDAGDLCRRLSSSGYEVERVAYFKTFTHGDQKRYGLIDEDLYFCRKRG